MFYKQVFNFIDLKAYFLIFIKIMIPDNNKELTKDIYPDHHKYNTFLKKIFRHDFRKNWFRRISTPLIENKSLFEKAFSGNERLLKSLYLINEWDDLCLTSDATVWVMRSYLENNMKEDIQPVYFYYMERFLDNSKDNKEFFQIWCEIIWEKDPILDAQLIFLAYSCLKNIWLWDLLKIRINTLGNEKEMTKYLEELSSFYENKKHMLSEESLKKLENNPLDLLRSKDEDEMILAKSSTPITKFLKKDSKKHYAQLKEYLELLEVPFEEDHTLVLEKNYYSNTMWTIDDINTNKSLVLWGRYDLLANRLDSESDFPASWLSVNTEEIISLLKEKEISIKNKDELDLYFVQLWDEAKKVVLPITLEARKAWINTLASLGTPSIKEQMLKANRTWAKYIVIVGLMEARSWVFQLRDMINWTQSEIKKEELIEYIIEQVWRDKLDFYSPAKDLIQK